VDDHLIALARLAGIDPMVERSLGNQHQGVRLLLSERARFRADVVRLERGRLAPLDIARRGQCLDQHRASFGRQPPANHNRTVDILIQMERAIGVASLGLIGLRLSVHAAPASDDALDVLGGASAADGKQSLLGLRRGHAGQRPNLGVRELPARQCLPEPRQVFQSARDANALSRRAQVQADAPRQPRCARAEAIVPALSNVELADEIERPHRGRVEVDRQLRDLVAQLLE